MKLIHLGTMNQGSWGRERIIIRPLVLFLARADSLDGENLLLLTCQYAIRVSHALRSLIRSRSAQTGASKLSAFKIAMTDVMRRTSNNY